MMTKKERIQAAIAGEKPDKLPYSFWTHLPGIDLNPELLAEKTYEFYKKYDIDFIKTTECTPSKTSVVRLIIQILRKAEWRKSQKHRSTKRRTGMN